MQFQDKEKHTSKTRKRSKTFLAVFFAFLMFGKMAFAQEPVISGVVFFWPSLQMMENVKLTFSGLGETYTNEIGYYQMSVPSGWSGSVTPSCPGYDFEDSTRTYISVMSDQVNQDYWEISDPHVVMSGTITHEVNAMPIEGVLLTFSGIGGTATTDTGGYYEHQLPYNWYGTVVPTLAGFNFSPDTTTHDSLNCYQYDQNFMAQDGPDKTISGKAYFLPGEEPIAVVQLVFSVVEDTVYTDSLGYFEHDLPFLWSGRITPYKENYDFDPSFRPITELAQDMENQDFWIEGSPVDTLSGTVTWTGGGPGIQDVTLYYGDTGDSVLTDSMGNYSIAVPYTWTGDVIPVKDNWFFEPDTNHYELVKENQSGEDYTILGPDTVVISGHIYSQTGGDVEGVALIYGGVDSVISDSFGLYSIEVPNGWSGIVKPRQNNYMFDIVSRYYSALDTHQVNQDYHVLGPANVEISGRVSFDGGAGIDAVAMIYGAENDTVYTDSDGYYTVIVPFDWSGGIKAEKECYDFTPFSYGYENVRDHISDKNYLVVGTPTAIISGIVRYEPDGPGLGDVIIRYGTGGDTVHTGGDGTYSFGVDLGWSGTVTPEKDDLLFDPDSRDYSDVQLHQNDQDYAVLGPAIVNVSGRVFFSPGEEPISDVTLYYGYSGDSVITDVDGNYSFSVVNGWSGIVTPSKTGYDFEPSSRPYIELNDHQTDQTFWVEGTPTLTISGTIKELDGTSVEDVVLKYSATDSVFSNATGFYFITVPYAWSGVVTPSKDDLIFAPESKTYTLINTNQGEQNYQVLGPGQIMISGQVYFHPGNEPIDEAVLYYGEGEDSVITDGAGNYCIVVENGWSGIVTPTKTGHDFEPSFRHYYDLIDHETDQDYWIDGSPLVSISGTVVRKDFTAMEDVVMKYTDDDSVLTDSEGFYSITLSHGWSGTITPESGDQLFDPESRLYSAVAEDIEDEDYQGQGPKIVTIAGTVYDTAGVALPDAIISYGSMGDTVMTGSDGTYSIALANGWSGTVSPSKDSLLFNPVSRIFTDLDTHQVNQNFNALGPMQVVISGYVLTSDGNGLEDVQMIYGAPHDTTSTGNDGYYQFTVAYGWEGTVTPVEASYIFSPAKRQYSPVSDHLTGEDYTGYPQDAYKAIVIDDQTNVVMDSLLQEQDMYHVFVDTLPVNLSQYDLIIFPDSSLVDPDMDTDLNSFIENGGSVILMGESPLALCGDSLCLNSIRNWFGSGVASRVASCNSIATVDNILGTDILEGDIVAEASSDSVMALNNLVEDAVPLTIWEQGTDNYHAFVREHESGKVGYISVFDLENINSKKLFSAMCFWAVSENTDINDIGMDTQQPAAFELLPSYPNPFNPLTTITYRVPQAARVRLEVFDINGRLVNVLFDGDVSSGKHTVQWHADDSHGIKVSSGTYICRMISGKHIHMQKIIFTK
ncbi:T9SS type A sorting domain-containing protein [bacterium]